MTGRNFIPRHLPAQRSGAVDTTYEERKSYEAGWNYRLVGGWSFDNDASTAWLTGFDANVARM